MDNLTDQEKSVLLAKAMGWYQVDYEPIMGARWQAPNKPEQYWLNPPNLYVTVNMSLAWRVLNWAAKQEAIISLGIFTWWYEQDSPRIYGGEAPLVLPPADAQRAWLDKILELAIEAGIIGTEEYA